ncbi:MAG: GNAT family N-acetyltransferase, partial [Bacteroidota bacterium]
MIVLERHRHLARHILHLLRSGQYREFARKFRERFYDETVLVGMRLDLLTFQREQALPDQLTVRPVRSGEIPTILDLGEPGLSSEEIHDRVIRQQMLRAGIETCYVAEDEGRTPCFIQWVIGADQNDILKRRFRGWYPRLAPDEVLIEYAYTLPARRRARIMPAVTSYLLERAKREGARSAVAYVPYWNRRSLKIHLRLGFGPYLLFKEKRRFLVRSRRH